MRNKIFGKQTLKLEGVNALPIWRSVYALLSILIAWCLIAEGIARTPLGYHLPPPSVGVDSFELDTKLYYLEQSIRRKGPLDCLILGDSMTNNGIDPTVLEKAYRVKTGSSIHCFNFGIPALFLDGSGPLAEILVNRFHPKLLIVLLSVRDFEPSVKFPVREAARSPWGQQNLGNSSLRGWAVNTLYGYRYGISLQYWLTPSNRQKLSDTWHSMTHEGFAPLYDQGDKRDLPASDLIFQKTEAAQRGFDRLLKLKQNGVPLLIIDAPIRPDLFNAHRADYFQPYLDDMQTTLEEQGVPFWQTDAFSKNMDPAGWYDFQHFNQRGVPAFSAWMGEQLAREFPPEFFK